MRPVLAPDELEAELRRIGAERYHSLHPFHALLHGGRLNKGQVRAWALNRYCYLAAIPRKDLTLMSRMEDPAMRREWLHRVSEHDGGEADPGGLERWLILTDGLGLDRTDVTSLRLALPATRFAVEAYVRFVGERSTLEAVASSLTELFAPAIHKERIAGMLANYDFIDDSVMQYFRRRLEEAPRDVGFALTTSSARRGHRSGSRPCSMPSASSATCSGRSSTPCISPTSSRRCRRPAPSSRRPGHDRGSALPGGRV